MGGERFLPAEWKKGFISNGQLGIKIGSLSDTDGHGLLRAG